jgi:acetylornithine deacetylase/succinyl-diaminopimelate desuccinylase-like protein
VKTEAPSAPRRLDASRARELVDRLWDASIVPALVEYIRIPNKSPGFDPEWRERGHMDRAVALIERFCREHAVPSMTVEVVREEGRTPVILMEVPGNVDDTVLLYGHLDKQPEMTGWGEGLGPWTPVQRGDRLYGRGGADDGYAAFACVAALRALIDQDAPRARCVILIEACEESGSFDLPHYVEALADRIGRPSLVVCLDSGCGNYEQLWCTASLRGLVSGTLRVEVLREGVHSGEAGGIVPSSFLVARRLLDRLEDERGGILAPELHVDIPPARREQARGVATALGDHVYTKFPFAGGTQPMSSDLTEIVLDGTWRPSLATVGAAGLPAIADAGNVLRPFTALKLSLRLPPTADPARASAAVKALLERDPPFGAKVTFTVGDQASGWAAPELAPWLERSLAAASETYFGAPAVHMGEGGSIPFMAMLGARFPEAQFLITGVLGPQSNAHGPNEFLHLPTAKKLSCCVAQVLVDHAQRRA